MVKRHGMKKGIARYYNLVRNFENWPAYLGYKHFGKNKPCLEFTTRKGQRIQVPIPVIREFKEIFMEESYVKHLPIPESQVEVVVDVGANVGFFSLFSLMRFPKARVLAFEPMPANLNRLKENLQQSPRVQVFPMAVGAKDGELELFTDTQEGLTTTAGILASSDRNLSFRVPSQSLETIFKNAKIETCDLLKLDCEGAEFEIIYSASPKLLSQIRALAIEVHEDSQDPTKTTSFLKKYLEGQGFTVRREGKGPLAMLWACHSPSSAALA